ncbi:TPA: hypothetical protein ACH3X1_012458 [Trebouxia sp. C0004]
MSNCPFFSWQSCCHCPSLATCRLTQHSLPKTITTPSDGDAMDTDAAMTQDLMSSQAEQQHLGGITYAHMARDKLQDAAKRAKKGSEKAEAPARGAAVNS